MPTSRSFRILFLIGAVATIGLGAGCSKTPDAVSVGTTVPGSTTAPKADAASAGGKKASCDPGELVPVIQKKYADAGVDHLVCLVPNAILTVKTGGDGTVAFLVQRDGQWAVGVDGPSADAEKLRPKDFPESMVRSWLDKRTSGTGAATTEPRPTSTKKPQVDGEGLVCTGVDASQVCVTSTVAKPTTTRPPTTPPPVTEPPTTAPPTSTPPTTFSQFCLENPLDPSCSGKK